MEAFAIVGMLLCMLLAGLGIAVIATLLFYVVKDATNKALGRGLNL